MTRPPSRALSRRRLLRVAGATSLTGVVALVGGCSDLIDQARDLRRPPPRRHADNEDQPLLETARADQQALLALCLAVREQHPNLPGPMDRVIEHHRTHVDALSSPTGGESAGHSPSARQTTASGPTESTMPPGPKVPRGERAALTAVVKAERDAAQTRAADAAAAASGDFARVLAAISASCAQHVVELQRAGREVAKAGPR